MSKLSGPLLIYFFFFLFFFYYYYYYYYFSIWLTLAIDKTSAEEGPSPSFFLATTYTCLQTLTHLFAVMHLRYLSHIFSHNACNYQTVIRWDLSTSGNRHLNFELFWSLISYMLLICLGQIVDLDWHQLSPLCYNCIN